jgi:hypothetical protein
MSAQSTGEMVRPVKLPIWDVMSRYKIQIKVIGLRQYRLRTWIAIRLLCIAAWLLGMGVEWEIGFPTLEMDVKDA